MDVEVRKVNGMSDFANLFLALYTIKNITEDEKLYIPKDIKEQIYFIFSCEQNVNLVRDFNIIDKDNQFDIELFFEKISLSTIKKYWRDKFTYDFSKDCIVTDGNIKNAEHEVGHFDEESIEIVESIVYQIEFCNKQNQKCNELSKKLIRSDD